MNLQWKSMITILVAVLVFLQSGPAHAYLNIKTTQTEEKVAKAGAAALGPVGLLAMVPPWGGAGAGAALGGKAMWIIIGVGGVVVALIVVGIILEEDGVGKIHYTRLSLEAAEQVGLTSAEHEAFNENVDDVNAVMEELRLLDSDENFEQHWAFYADELGWDQDMRWAVGKMNHLFHHIITQ